MLKIQFSGEYERDFTPVFVCDHCHQRIDDLKCGIAMFPDHTDEEEEQPRDVKHFHNGRCFDEGESIYQKKGRAVAWHHLHDHVEEIKHSLSELGNPTVVFEAPISGSDPEIES